MTGPVFKTGEPSFARRLVGSTPMRLRQMRTVETGPVGAVSNGADWRQVGEQVGEQLGELARTDGRRRAQACAVRAVAPRTARWMALVAVRTRSGRAWA